MNKETNRVNIDMHVDIGKKDMKEQQEQQRKKKTTGINLITGIGRTDGVRRTELMLEKEMAANRIYNGTV